ncbi:hypothetical protein ILYODFUR_013803 [Ilyodon furcidens]|uniref:Uncharacterized protein n=1 Tax=Ilyodon furcidens TaxID=33524 RepID=A0ABV0SM85_9TELE
MKRVRSSVGSSGTESAGGFQWRLSGTQGPLFRLKDVPPLIFYPPSFLKPPLWPLVLKSLDMKEGKKRGTRNWVP